MVEGWLEDISDASTAFIAVSPTARTSGDIRLKGYASSSGRLDVVARVWLAVKEFPRTILASVLLGPPNPPITIVAGDRCRGRVSSERGFISEYVVGIRRGRGCMKILRGIGLHDLLQTTKKSGFTIVYLHESGVDVANRSLAGILCSERVAFVMSSHVDMPQSEERIVRAFSDAIISLGPLSYHAEHAALAAASARESACTRQAYG